MKKLRLLSFVSFVLVLGFSISAPTFAGSGCTPGGPGGILHPTTDMDICSNNTYTMVAYGGCSIIEYQWHFVESDTWVTTTTPFLQFTPWGVSLSIGTNTVEITALVDTGSGTAIILPTFSITLTGIPGTCM